MISIRQMCAVIEKDAFSALKSEIVKKIKRELIRVLRSNFEIDLLSP